MRDGDQPDGVLVQPLGREVHLDIGLEAPLVAGLGDGLDGIERFGDGRHRIVLFGGRQRRDGARPGCGTARGMAASCMSARVMADQRLLDRLVHRVPAAAHRAQSTGTRTPRPTHRRRRSARSAHRPRRSRRRPGWRPAAASAGSRRARRAARRPARRRPAFSAPWRRSAPGCRWSRRCPGEVCTPLLARQAHQHHNRIIGQLRQPQHGLRNPLNLWRSANRTNWVLIDREMAYPALQRQGVVARFATDQ